MNNAKINFIFIFLVVFSISASFSVTAFAPLKKSPLTTIVTVTSSFPVSTLIQECCLSSYSPSLLKSESYLFRDTQKTESEIIFNQDEQNWIKSHPIIFYSITNDETPLSFSSTAGSPAGFVAEKLNDLGQRIGVVFQGRSRRTQQELFADIQQGNSTFIPYVYKLPKDKSDLLSLTIPYNYSLLVIISRKEGPHFENIAALKGKVIALTASPKRVLLGDLKGLPFNMTLQSKTSDALKLLTQGNVDAVIADFTLASYEISHNYQNKLVIDGPALPPPSYVPYSVGVAKNQPEFLSIMNKVILSLPSNYFEFKQQYDANSPFPDTSFLRYQNKILVSAAIVFIIILFSFIWVNLLWIQIAKRKNTEIKLLNELSFQRAMFDNLPLAMFVVKSDYKIGSANPAFIDLLRIPTSDADDPTLYVLHEYPYFFTQLREIYHQSRDTGRACFKDLSFTIEHETSHLYTWCIPFYNNFGEIAGMLSGWLDISERTRLETALRQAKELADKANRAKSTFLSTISHEIRTPLNVIIGMLELQLHSNELALQQRNELTIANESSQHLLMLIDDLLDLSKIEADKMVLQPQPICLSEQLGLLERMFSPMAKSKGLDFILQLNGDATDCWLLADPLRLRQILANLLSNAVKFTRQGKITFQCTANRKPDSDSITVTFEVSDTGVGIATADIPRLFSPFTQIEEAARYAGGTGLGLTISRRLLEMMAGYITLNSELGKGTQLHVCVTFPAVQPVENALPIDAATLVQSLPESPRILIVDDHSANRILLSTQLQQLGANVTTANDGIHALELMANNKFYLIITDVAMPVMSGMTLAEKIRQREVTRGETRVPIVGLTAFVEPEIFDEAIAAGMDLCLRKPIGLVKWAEILPQFCLSPLNPGTELSLEQGLQQRLLEALANQQSAVAIFLQSLWQSTLADRREAQLHQQNGDWLLLSETIHRLKGPFSFIHQDDIVSICNQLDILCRENAPNPDAISQALTFLVQQLDDFKSQLDKLGYLNLE
ncbi:ATP-binding protein [Serratia fonticola]|uniref:ATP-binding protein n=1 Tax=Serratia fonticola TaxID=47917 RepID=UPI00192C2505|nr:ATP-binding protein [Serratia fonticola]MBL5903998.1 response regulator [Serratia fonticola]